MAKSERDRPVAGTDESEEQPDTIDLGRRSFADTNFANDQRQQGQSDRESERTRDHGSLGDHEQDAGDESPHGRTSGGG